MDFHYMPWVFAVLSEFSLKYKKIIFLITIKTSIFLDTYEVQKGFESLESLHVDEKIFIDFTSACS